MADHTCQQHTPGSLGCYTRHGCRCTPCRTIHARSCKRATVGLSRMVPDIGTRRRLQALAALGWQMNQIADTLGIHPRNLLRLRAGRAGGRVQQGTAARVRDIYDQISMTLPPDTPQARRRRTTARQKGWLPPLAWDDATIDKPDTKPYMTGRWGKPGSTAEDLAWMVEAGESLLGIQARTGLSISGIEHALKRSGQTHLWDRIKRRGAA
ncbi:MAG: hypothetical protein QM804_10240 [Propionicimonas sp.]